jgi:hypothetical protein
LEPAHVQVNGLRGNKTLIDYSMADAPEAKPVRRQLGEVPVVGSGPAARCTCWPTGAATRPVRYRTAS